MPRAKAGEKTRVQFGPDDWIAAATRVLVNRSIDAVGVESLAKELGVTKGSFYWHFKDRNDLLRRMLTAWRDRATEQIIASFESRKLPPRKLIQDLLDLPSREVMAHESASIELAIRAWGRRDEMARAVIEEVDAKRLSYIAQCFSALGFNIGDARTRAFVLYGYEVSESIVGGKSSKAQKAERRAFMERMLLSDAE
ncbi:TetR/AcrR family transcriptional regulator [Pandoraea pulmonicola]|uniref:DNA-binding transcriptional repressor AcrR n=1 Tax=Pandoraea pulmonicola TaxID=93221 RepID=A0AAJ4ZGE7_PANPU|nr:TetR/AcrR family transcriptional regulator [Pandoraea pulmonicola]AJC22907.1 TetR family transcriptional regulator [Pandoraea pulmonicola]SUA92761.1 DNA-binding transcriptional repressor AcrR [Pandoraea pulmonicola]